MVPQRSLWLYAVKRPFPLQLIEFTTFRFYWMNYVLIEFASPPFLTEFYCNAYCLIMLIINLLFCARGHYVSHSFVLCGQIDCIGWILRLKLIRNLHILYIWAPTVCIGFAFARKAVEWSKNVNRTTKTSESLNIEYLCWTIIISMKLYIY